MCEICVLDFTHTRSVECITNASVFLLQEDLADSLSCLVHCFQDVEMSFRFLDAFFQTEGREWNLIDYFRMDKFMMVLSVQTFHISTCHSYMKVMPLTAILFFVSLGIRQRCCFFQIFWKFPATKQQSLLGPQYPHHNSLGFFFFFF